jgi:hypothetical protein
MTNYLQPHQARTVEPTPYEKKLAGAIEEVFGTGRHDLEGLVSGLNGMGVPAPGGEVWTTDSFTAEMKRLASPQGSAGKEA